MSLIESALKKVQGQPGVKPAEGIHPAARRAASVPRPAVVDPATVRQYPRVELDAAAMERNCILPQVNDKAALRAYKILRTRLLQRLNANGWHSVGITGTESEQGKTLTAINLAIALAQDPGTWVYLVDLDLQRPRVASYLGMSFGPGLGEYLTGEAELDQIIYSPAGIDRLAIVPNTRSFQNSSEHLASPRAHELVHALASEEPRRIIIYDLPPLLMSDDVLTFVPQVDGVLLVLTEGVTERGSIERARELLAEMNVIGTVLNRSAERDDSYYY